MDLSGRWDFQLDPDDHGLSSNFWESPRADSITLPGTTSQASKGNPLKIEPVLLAASAEDWDPRHGLTFGRDTNALENSSLSHLDELYSYIGPAWYHRTVEIPKGWKSEYVELVLERVMWDSRVWINGRFLGERNSLTTPHRYDIGFALEPGRNDIVIRVDNRRHLAIGDPHAYTEQSQTIWNGIIGQIALIASDPVSINHLELRPDLVRRGVEVTVQTRNDSGREMATTLSMQAGPENFKGKAPPVLVSSISIAAGEGTQKFFYPMGTNFERWDEFNPKLYQMRASLAGESPESATASVFGMREFKTDDHHFTINGQPTFLRGSVNCCEFPETGYPDMTGRQWQKIFFTLKAYGFNHVRFHTWCPPEIAFETADRYGIYLEVELPNWCFHLGQDTNVTEFFHEEGERMIREYGNHPSWVMLTMGNELKGDYRVLDGLETQFRELDPQLLYGSTTYPSSPERGKVSGPADDYYISQDTKYGRARGQDIFNDTPPNTETNFEHAVSCIPVPFISHEVGQYCVYPDLTEITKYRGPLRNLAFEAVRADLKQKGRLVEAAIYTHDSGELAALLYKEEIERALRTTNQAGFQLLELNDFPGQGTSTVGLLDAFWDSKGLITPEAFRKFCGPVVPLMLIPKRVYQNNETFDADVEIANFGPGPIANATVVWKILDGRKKIGTGVFHPQSIELGQRIMLGHIRQSLAVVTRPTKLTVTVSLPGTAIANNWSIWVYPANDVAQTNDIQVCYQADAAFYEALRQGKRVLLEPSQDDVKSPLATQFVPVFWNPVMFPNQQGSMGAMIDAKSPLFAKFPTDSWTDWQWWELLHRSFAINLEGISPALAMPFRFVDKFNRNALPAAIFEARVGAGKLLICTLDIHSNLDKRIAARQLRRSIFDYMNSRQFQPSGELSPDTLGKMFAYRELESGSTP